MTVPVFRNNREIIDYAFNGNDPWVLSLVRHKVQQKDLNAGDVNKYIKEELKSFQDNYDNWVDKEHG
tara:strand:+ start:1503 stop:1703 length:201 start_codon:yes stop_codon:yes gene_type:complete